MFVMRKSLAPRSVGNKVHVALQIHSRGQLRKHLLDRPAMLTIYGVYRSRASRNLWLADELGIPFKHVPVIQHYRLPDATAPDAPINTRSPEFLKVNPNGHIPSIDDDGLILHESLAINLYLAKKHGGPLAPANVAEDGQMTMWTLWAATEIETNALNVAYHRVGNPSGVKDPKIADAAVAALRGPFAVLDKALADSGYLVGGRFTVADINVAEIVRYALPAPELFEATPHVKAWLTTCQSRPAFRKMWEKRDSEPA
jgi:glutathione S-transferase